ncbi:hypothetical protein J7J84_03310 [bacterium]|nr:hypothetical protein [bacterium]
MTEARGYKWADDSSVYVSGVGKKLKKAFEKQGFRDIGISGDFSPVPTP